MTWSPNTFKQASPVHRRHCLWLTGLVVFLNACSYGHREFRQAGKFPVSVDYVLELDDFGRLWDRNVPEKALSAIKEELKQRNTIVVLFVHGWHHNAAPDDANLRAFGESLNAIRAKLWEPLYRKSRFELTQSDDVKVIGIYVGWRGRSLPWIFDYATFWGRKAAAERVGEGDLREFLIRLNTIYRDQSAARYDKNAPHDKNAARQKSSNVLPFMGLVSFGHSFGGQVLFKLVASTLEQELIRATSLAARPRARTMIKEPLQGFGDVTILVNPALEALQYDRIHQLSAQLAYDRRQTPLLLVLSAENDLARKVAFPIGRWWTALVGPATRLKQRDLWTTALGEYEPQRTHEITLVSEPNNFAPEDYAQNPCRILDLDLTDVPTIGGVQLTPSGPEHQPFSPFIVAHASLKVILGHTGIFEDDLRNFLNDYIAILEGKKMLLGNKDLANKCMISAK